jgi:hypothetical protein
MAGCEVEKCWKNFAHNGTVKGMFFGDISDNTHE